MSGFEVRELSFGYSGMPLFDRFSLGIPEGEYLAVIGPNGAGKSTLLRLLSGLLTPAAGKVLVYGQDIRSMARSAIARLVAVVSQDSQFAFGYTIEEVVMMGRNPWLGRFQMPSVRDRALVEAALETMDLLTLRGARVDEVSGGERQRAIIARALVQDTPIILLDEPVTHLDLSHQAGLAALLSRIAGSGAVSAAGMPAWEARSRTIVLVSHDINFASANCRRLLVLKQGAVVACGTPAEVLTVELVRSVYGVSPLMIEHPRSGRPVLLLPGQGEGISRSESGGRLSGAGSGSSAG